MFGRKTRNNEDDEDFDASDSIADGQAHGQSAPDEPLEDYDADGVPIRRTLTAPSGPWDGAAPDDGRNRVDLGGLLVPVDDGLELRVDLDPSMETVVSLTLATPNSAMQVMAFAAPRSAGIWAEVRAEILASLERDGGSAVERDEPYGCELHAQVPTETPGALAPARFVGVDGPRWFLRAMVQGQAAVDPAVDAALLAAFGQVVVIRGEVAMAVRDPLPLRLPRDVPVAGLPPELEALRQGAPVDEPSAAEPYPLDLPRRGPEMTETA